MNVLRKLQSRTLNKLQVAGYAVSLFVGTTLLLLAVQTHSDLRPALEEQTEVFDRQAVTVSKKITLFKTADKERIYFSDKDIEELQQQPFVESVARFGSATFHTSASLSMGHGIPEFSTDLFFESVPDDYIDVQSDNWLWDSASDFLPVIIPQDYLNLYNFGFAESQSLPVVSETVIENIVFKVHVSGNGREQTFNSRIVGFTGKINSILVPDKFLRWANERFGTHAESKSSRLLVEFGDATDEAIPEFFAGKDLDINQGELDRSKLSSVFRLSMLFVFAVAIVIIVLSAVFIIMSINLLVQRNKTLLTTLYDLGYTTGDIALYYRVVFSTVSAVTTVLSVCVVAALRGLYIDKLSHVFELGGSPLPALPLGTAVLIAMLIVCVAGVGSTIGNTVRKRQGT